MPTTTVELLIHISKGIRNVNIVLTIFLVLFTVLMVVGVIVLPTMTKHLDMRGLGLGLSEGVFEGFTKDPEFAEKVEKQGKKLLKFFGLE